MTELRAIIDYETRSRIPLEKTGAIPYAKDFSTSIFCVGYRINGQRSLLWIPERASMPGDLWECFKLGTLVAHNAAFERAITRWCLTRYDTLTDEQREVLFNLTPDRWRCTAAKAAMCALPRSLEMAGAALSLPIQKDMAGNKLIKKYCKPRKPSKKNPNHWWGDRKDLRAIYRYCLKDVDVEYILDQELPDLSPREQEIWELDQVINDRGVLIDIPTVKTILSMVHEETANITRKVRQLSGGTIDTVTQTAKVLKWLNHQGAEMPNLQAATIRDKLLDDNLHPDARSMLEYRQGGSKTSTGKYIAMLSGVGDDNRARELLLYAGAIPTARWSGRRLQVQNFPRPTVKDFNSDEAIKVIQKGGLLGVEKAYGESQVMNVLVSSIRGMLIASPGCELFCADFASVEARLAFWVAEHEEGLQAFRDGRKLYEEMAAATFDMKLEEVGKESLERFVGKESILGAQYGLGADRFLKNCWRKGMKKVTEEIAKRAVYTYRKVHWPIPALWKNLEHAIVAAIMNPGSQHSTNKVLIYTSGDFLCIKLPSGRRLRYYKPRVSQKQLAGGRMVPRISYWTMDLHQWQEVVGWGGIFTNHVVQGIARDLMAHAMLNIEKAGYRMLLSVHDEALAEREKGQGSVKEFVDLMAGQLPKWAKGAPIDAAGWSGFRYRK